jgi:hypothetical protein
MSIYSNSVEPQDTKTGATFGGAVQARQSRRAQIEAFFLTNLAKRFDTNLLHQRFGTSFRARASEINRDPASPIQIFNKTSVGKDALGQPCERSAYWAEPRAPWEAAPSTQSDSEYMARVRAEEATAMPLFAEVPE